MKDHRHMVCGNFPIDRQHSGNINMESLKIGMKFDTDQPKCFDSSDFFFVILVIPVQCAKAEEALVRPAYACNEVIDAFCLCLVCRRRKKSPA